LKISDVIKVTPLERTPKPHVETINAHNLALSPGLTEDFTITGDVQPLAKNVWYVPVNGRNHNGNYRLTRTGLLLLSRKLGDDSTNWIGARFTSFVSLKRNPREESQTVGFDIMADSVRTPKRA
jgi:hypothetical protein